MIAAEGGRRSLGCDVRQRLLPAARFTRTRPETVSLPVGSRTGGVRTSYLQSSASVIQRRAAGRRRPEERTVPRVGVCSGKCREALNFRGCHRSPPCGGRVFDIRVGLEHPPLWQGNRGAGTEGRDWISGVDTAGKQAGPHRFRMPPGKREAMTRNAGGRVRPAGWATRRAGLWPSAVTPVNGRGHARRGEALSFREAIG